MLAFTCLIGWPLVGFLVGGVTGDAPAWHSGPPAREALPRLTWLLAPPCLIRAAMQAPIWLAGQLRLDRPRRGDPGSRHPPHPGLGWVLRIACYGTMIWLLARNHTPVAPDAAPA